ncbi:hypothetical protein B1H58_06040 [Pantoea alhagi]|uniref:DUF8093 domain-containing protein n=1 Tax=Pantoea alhagi TaxID=1891675 RepID=A0A1W6B3J5_9GAMM|nr:hypothetical protein [Pantoea alhagi]ARJ41619.1 hypothetical protein B1H58_06040 [Pantoea alhagi]
MGASLPGNRLICLSRDTLAPESFERIISPLAAWRHIEQDYRFDDRWNNSLYIVNIFPKSAHPLAATLPEYGRRSKEQLKALTERGEVVCLNDVSVLPAGLFYIDDNGMLICRDRTLFRFDGANSIIAAFNLAVSKRDYRYSGGKPTPTSSGQLRGGSQPAVYHTLNSKNVGRLLAAGGIYNGNVEGFRKTAEQLGGDAPAGYNQVLNETTRGVAIAGASIAVGLGIRRLNTARELEALQQNKISFEAAKDRYPKQYEQYNKLPDKNLEKAIYKHEKQIIEHQGYLNDPVKRLEHVPDWERLSHQHQENLLHHWQQDIKRHEAYKTIAEGIIKGRK